MTYGVVFLVLLFSATALSFAVERDVRITGDGDANMASLLFSIDARSSQIVSSREESENELLVLYGVNPAVVWFTDRPRRASGLMPLSDFMNDWQSFGFVSDPPNAEVVLHSGSRAVVELTHPRYDPTSATWMATIAFLDGSLSSAIPRDEDLGSAHLFIDDADWNIPDIPSTSTDTEAAPDGLPVTVPIPAMQGDTWEIPVPSLVNDYRAPQAEDRPGAVIIAETEAEPN